MLNIVIFGAPGSGKGTSKSNITDTSCPRSASIFFNASAWAMVLVRVLRVNVL